MANLVKRIQSRKKTAAQLAALVARQEKALRREAARLEALRARHAAHAAKEAIPQEVLAHRALVRRVHALVVKKIPHTATALIVTQGDAALLAQSCKTSWHFPRRCTGEPLGCDPAGELAAIAQLESGRAAGAQFFVLPEPSLWWLNHYAGFRRHLEERYRLVAHAPDTAAIWSLTQKPAAGAKNLAAQFAEVIAEFQTRCGRDPVILDWHAGDDLKKGFPQLTVFQPAADKNSLPYLDRTADLVVVAANQKANLPEARRVAGAAVVRVDAKKKTLAVEWQPDFSSAKQTSVSVVMPCYNGAAMTDACVRSLLETLPRGLAVEVIVVDDCATDGTAAMLKRWARSDARVKYFRNRKNLGFVDTCNFGAAQATGEILVFLNNDLALLPGWLEPLLRVFRERADAGVVGGKLIFPDGTFQEAGGVVFRDGSAMNFGRTEADLTAPLFNFLREVDYCSGALFATPREFFQKLGGFDTEFRPGYFEDTDYCFRTRAVGRKVYFQPESAVVHREGGTAGTDTAKGMKRYQVVNHGKFLARWRGALRKQPVRPKDLSRARQQLAFAIRGARRALVTSHCVPRHDRNSGDRRVMDHVEFLLADGWTVVFVSPGQPGDEIYRRELQQLGVAVFDGRTLKLDELLAAAHFDLALMAFWSEAEKYLATIRQVSPATRIVVDSVDLHFLRNARQIFGGQSERLTAELDSAFGHEVIRELNIYAAADAVLTVSRKEADWIADLTAQKSFVAVLPDSEPMAVSKLPGADRHGVVFVGSFRHPPNVDAVRWLCAEVLPLVPAELLAAHPVYILGDALTDAVRAFAKNSPAVRMVGWVTSVTPYLERARASVIPLRYGAGTKRKLLQTLMAGTPAVSTSIGTEGFHLRDGENVLVADDAENFAAALTRLLREDELWQRLAAAGRTHIESLHGRRTAQQRLHEIIARVQAAPPKRVAAATGAAQPARLDGAQYEKLCARVQKFAESRLPRRAKILVVSRGDDALVKFPGRIGSHFPQNAQGVYAGHHPADSAEAIAHLEQLRGRGHEYLLFPATASWWLAHYGEFAAHLRSQCKPVARLAGVGEIFDLRPAKKKIARRRRTRIAR